MTTRIYLLRHAETADPRVFHGAESDVGLSARGQAQTEQIGRWLAARSPAVVVSSAMKRAVDTAAPVARACGVPHRLEPDLHERRIGVLSGTANTDPDGPWPATCRRWAAGETGFATPGAESYDDIRARVVPVFERVARDLEGQTFAVVAHGVVIRVLLLSLLPGYSAADYMRLGSVPNVAVSELTWDGSVWEGVSLCQVVVSA